MRKVFLFVSIEIQLERLSFVFYGAFPWLLSRGEVESIPGGISGADSIEFSLFASIGFHFLRLHERDWQSLAPALSLSCASLAPISSSKASSWISSVLISVKMPSEICFL